MTPRLGLATLDDVPVVLDPQQRLGRYVLHHRLGEGGMAEVFCAREHGAQGLGRWVAIKRIHLRFARQQRFVEMMLDEARLCASITHPNVAQVLDLGEADGVPFIVMEYLNGHSLAAVIRRSFAAGEATVDLMARIVANACEGAHAAHEHRGIDGIPSGLVHRDLSPANVFVTYDGAVKVVDFGIAKAPGRVTLTDPGTLKGNFAYMSPEQARGHDLDRRSDVYTLGLVLYEATTGVRAFTANNDLDLILKAEQADVPAPSTVREGYPIVLEAIVMRALAERREDRFATARDMGEALDRFVVERRAPTGPAQIAALMTRLFSDRIRERAALLAVSPVEAPAPAAPVVERPVAPVREVEREPDPTEKTAVASRRSTSHRAGRTLVVSTSIVIFLAVVAVLAWVSSRPAVPAAGAPATVAERPAPVDLPAPRVPAPTAAPVPEPRPVEPEAPAPAPTGAEKRERPEGFGTLDLRSEPWARIWVDGRSHDVTPIVGLALAAGPHRVKLVTEDGRSKSLRVRIAPGRPTSIDVRF